MASVSVDERCEIALGDKRLEMVIEFTYLGCSVIMEMY